MEVKKLFLMSFILGSVAVSAQQAVKSTAADSRQVKKAERREKINQLIKQARKKPIAHIAPFATRNISRVSTKSMSTSDPTIIDVILDSIELLRNKVNNILKNI